MKKSIVIILIILFGFNGLCYGEIRDYWNNERKISWMDYMILKVEMRLRDNFILESLLHSQNNDYNSILPRVIFVGYLGISKKIKIGYSIGNKKLFLSLTPIEKELELNKHIDRILEITDESQLISQVTKEDLIVYFWIEGGEVSVLENGKWDIK